MAMDLPTQSFTIFLPDIAITIPLLGSMTEPFLSTLIKYNHDQPVSTNTIMTNLTTTNHFNHDLPPWNQQDNPKQLNNHEIIGLSLLIMGLINNKTPIKSNNTP